MQISTRVTHNPSETLAVEALLSDLITDSLKSVLCYYTEDYDEHALRAAFVDSLPKNVSLIGASTCRGLMTDTGVHTGQVVAVMAIYDDKHSVYGNSLCRIQKDMSISETVSVSIDKTLENLDRVGEAPNFIVLHAAPGIEEEVIATIDQKFGLPIPIIGGSAADNHIAGNWSLFTEEAAVTEGAAIQLFFSSSNITANFSAGYIPTEFNGIATKVEGRELLEIDHQPAQSVYREWIADHAGIEVPKGFVFDLVTQYPLGRIAGTVFKQPYFKLSHPIKITGEEGIHLFTGICQGDSVTLMSGSIEQLVHRGARVVKETKRNNSFEAKEIGAMCIICAGSMLLLKEELESLYIQIKNELEDTPFICPFTFGEQGRFVGGDTGHGNLMFSAASFYESS